MSMFEAGDAKLREVDHPPVGPLVHAAAEGIAPAHCPFHGGRDIAERVGETAHLKILAEHLPHGSKVPRGRGVGERRTLHAKRYMLGRVAADLMALGVDLLEQL